MGDPRDEHYFFSHEFLRNLYFEFYKTLNSQDFAERGMDVNMFIRFMWHEFLNLVNFPNKKELESETHPVEVIDFDDDRELWIITMPEPKFKTEAYFMGLIFSKDEKKKIKNPLYFTLECSDENNSFFCFWDKSERHHNHGLVEPTKEAFVESIKEFYGNGVRRV
jgi:hypothetical protein